MDEKTTSRDLTARQRDLYNERYAVETRVDLGSYPDDFLDVRLRSLWSLLPRRPHVLDVGCGSGTLVVRKRVPQPLQYVGLDISRTGLISAKEGIGAAPCFRFINSSTQDLPFRDGVFDGLYAISVIEHLPDPESFLDECARVLKPAGIVVLHTPNTEDRFSADGCLRRFLPGVYTRRNHAVGHHYERFIAPRALNHMLVKRELKAIKLQYTDTLFEWLWVHLLWPKALGFARRPLEPAPRPDSDVSVSRSEGSTALDRAVRLYNSVIFPFVRLVCWPDRLIELSGNSGGYIVVGRKAP